MTPEEQAHRALIEKVCTQARKVLCGEVSVERAAAEIGMMPFELWHIYDYYGPGGPRQA